MIALLPILALLQGADRTHPDTLAYRSAARGIEVLERGLEAHGGAEALGRVAGLGADLAGKLVYVGDWRAPDDRHEWELSGRYELAPALDADRLDLVVRDERGERRTRTLRWGERCVAWQERSGPDGEPQVRLTAEDDPDDVEELSDALPLAILLRARARAATLVHLGREERDGRACEVVTFCEADGRPKALVFDAGSGLLAAVERHFRRPHRGDTVQSIAFDDYRDVEGLQLPGRRVEVREEAARWSRSEVELTSWVLHPDVEPASFAVPEALAEEVGPWSPGRISAEPASVPEVLDLGDGLHVCELEEADARVLFAEFADHVVALEAPVDSAVGEHVLAAIRAAFPGKPLRYVVPSHHHGHYVGGIRPFVAAGVTVVTTPGNLELVRRLCAWPQRVEPDALARRPAEPEFLVVRGSLVLEDATQRLELHDVGDAVPHTDEYLVSYVPAARLLFQGDLGSFPAEGDIPPADSWSRGLHAGVVARGLDVEHVVQCWPLRGTRRVAAWADLEASVEAADSDGR